MSAAWVEALAALGTVVVTALYAGLTWRIAKSANLQAEVSRRQTQDLIDAEERAKRDAHLVLWARATYLLRQLAKLPDRLEGDWQAPRAAWREQDERALEEAAALIGGATVVEAAEAATDLGQLRRHQRTQRTSISQVEPVPPAPVSLSAENWERTRMRVHDMLVRLESTGAGTRVGPTIRGFDAGTRTPLALDAPRNLKGPA